VYSPGNLRILIANEAALRLYGYTRKEFVTLRTTDLETGAESPAPPGRHPAGSFADGEHQHRTANGGVVSVDLHSEPIEVDGQAARLVFAEDVTERNRLRRAALDAADRATRQLGRELHDGLGQEIVALVMQIRNEVERLQRGESADVEALRLMEVVSLRALASCRNVARGLSALSETDGDLCRALRELPALFPHDGPPAITVTVTTARQLRLPIATRDHIYRITQEALTNAVKHAKAQGVDIHLEVGDSLVVLTVRDDGIGFSAESPTSGGVGLASMRHRADAIGGKLRFASTPGRGTEVRLECPQPSPEPAIADLAP
jgi:PAS domain S-box-containing protein